MVKNLSGGTKDKVTYDNLSNPTNSLKNPSANSSNFSFVPHLLPQLDLNRVSGVSSIS
jgi:hypothetical protein